MSTTPVELSIHGRTLKVWPYEPIHQSGVRLARQCLRRYLFERLMKLRLKGAYAPALELGSIFHQVAGELLWGKTVPEVRKRVSSYVAESCAKAEELAAGSAYLPDGSNLDSRKEAIEVDAAKALAMAEWYVQHAEPLPPDLKILDVEKQTAQRVSIGTRRLSGLKEVRSTVMEGTIDVLARDSDGRLWIIDHKTTDKSPMDVLSAMIFDIQTFVYWELVRSLYGEIPAGFIHVVIKKPRLGLTQALRKTADPIDGYCKKVKEWFNEQALLGQHNPRAKPVVRSKVTGLKELPDDAKALIADLHDRKAALRRTPDGLIRQWPRVCDRYVCTNQYGKTCPYLRLCDSHEGDQWHLMTLDYEQPEE